MNRALTFATRMADEIARRSGVLGERVALDPVRVLDRSDAVKLAPPGRRSANGSCRLARAADAWVAINLARVEDRELLPAWLEWDGNPWLAIRRRGSAELVARARMLGLPCAVVGETSAAPPMLSRRGHAVDRSISRVVDLSSLWAGPLCAGIFAAMGADVVKVESVTRRDRGPAGLDARLNGGKRRWALDFTIAADRERLSAMIVTADVVVTSARRRVFESLGITPEHAFASNPGLIWVAISGHGWGESADRVAFGDDAAAAGGLVRWTAAGEPRFLGDAIADPLTGLAAAAAAFEAVERGGGFLVDASMAGVAAWAAGGR